MKKKSVLLSLVAVAILLNMLIFEIYHYNCKTLTTASSVTEDYTSITNKKICWGIKRADNHDQPDVGAENKRAMDKYNALYMGNAEKKYVYLSFDAGYEAGYTNNILETLKQNNVTATFFITGHYLNTQPDLVQKMIENGNTVGNHTPNCLMSGIYII